FMLICVFVCGLWPRLPSRYESKNVPNPTRVTLPPFFRVFVTAFVKESNAAFACVFVIPVSSAIISIRSALFMMVSFLDDNGGKFSCFCLAAKFFYLFFRIYKITGNLLWERVSSNRDFKVLLLLC